MALLFYNATPLLVHRIISHHCLGGANIKKSTNLRACFFFSIDARCNYPRKMQIKFSELHCLHFNDGVNGFIGAVLWIRIRNLDMHQIESRILIKVKGRIRIRIKVTSRIRIRINNTALVIRRGVICG